MTSRTELFTISYSTVERDCTDRTTRKDTSVIPADSRKTVCAPRGHDRVPAKRPTGRVYEGHSLPQFVSTTVISAKFTGPSPVVSPGPVLGE